MAFYHRLGTVPPKPHTTLYKADGKSLYREELFSTLGFWGVFSNKYHIHIPSKVLRQKPVERPSAPEWKDAPLMFHHFFTEKNPSSGDFVSARNVYLFNANCIISTAHVTQPPAVFYRSMYDEYIFVHHGSGAFLSDYGRIRFVAGDQIVVPKGTTYLMEFDSYERVKLLVVESTTAFEIPKKYRNEYGQLVEGAPFCERDIKLPEFVEPVDQAGEFPLLLKARDRYFELTLASHPFDVVGWDGYNFPWAFNIKDFCPIVGKVHQPPPVHLFLDTRHFVLCNFVPRLFDFHPQAIPAPYYHSNIDSDEVLYYAEGDFMSRTGVADGSVTLHPGGIPHGPQPGKTEASIGAKETKEYAVMIDTFESLRLTTSVQQALDGSYPTSWLRE